MIFGPTDLSDAVGAILAHGTKHTKGMFKKGRLLSVADVEALRAAGHASVIAARLGPDDVPEDEAARLISTAVCGLGARHQEPFTGRANLYAIGNGVLVVDETRLRALNHLHESLTLATLPNFSRVEARQMVATVKVIPFAVPRKVLEDGISIIGRQPLLRVAAFQPKRAGLIITRLPQTKPSVIAKSERAMRERLEAMGGQLASVTVTDHLPENVSAAIALQKTQGLDPILVFGASAIVDRADVIPSAVVAAGGEVVHLGMPVDPGNLLMLGRSGETSIIGVPSCARSPKVNGFDWVLERAMAGLQVSGSDLMDMGVGGLLAEIPSRPSPREGRGETPSAPRIAAVVLAAGLSSRMGANKLLADFKGEPLIRSVVRNVRSAAADRIIVVTGHESGKISSVLADMDVQFILNTEYQSGLSSSLRVGVEAADDADAVLVCLGDMPKIAPRSIDRLIAAFNPAEHRSIVVPTHKGELGHPVLWGQKHFARLMMLTGDRGARNLLAELTSELVEVEVDDPGILADADTAEALAALNQG
jgi:molybdenum cofactor cytidylyltransferase